MLATEAIPPLPPPRHASIRMSTSSDSVMTPISSPGSSHRENVFFNGHGSAMSNRMARPFATQRWNLILSVFYEQMPLKRHWRCLWPYDETFTGSEAVDFLCTVLPKLVIHDRPIVRAQCFQLLQRFLLNRFIVNARDSKNYVFNDSSSTLFKFERRVIEYEISKTAESSFNESRAPSPYSDETPSPDDGPLRFRRTASVRNQNNGSSASSESSSSGIRGLFRSFRAPKRYAPVAPPPPKLYFPPPPTTPPPPLDTDHFRKRHHPLSPLLPSKLVRRQAFVNF